MAEREGSAPGGESTTEEPPRPAAPPEATVPVIANAGADALPIEGADAAIATQPSPVGRAVLGLQGDAPRIVANWVLRVSNLPAFRAVPDLGLTRLQEAVPDLATATLAAIATPDLGLDPEPLGAAEAAAARHGRQRACDGFPIGALLAELHQLRIEICATIERLALADPELATVSGDLEGRLDQTSDDAVIAAAEAWVATRFQDDPEP